MKSLFLSPALFLLMALPASAQQRHELTVRDAVELAYKNVVQLKNAQIDYRIQEARNREILGQAYPQLSGTAGFNYYLKLPGFLFPDATSSAVYSILKEEGVQGSNGPITEVPAPVFRQVSFQQPWNVQAGAQLTQLLFQPDVFVGLQARQTALDLQSSIIEQTKEGIKDTAYRRYYAILIAERQLRFLDEGLVRLQKLYRDDSIMYVNGFAERLDLDKVQVQINNLRTSRNAVANGVNLSYAALKFAIGVPQTDTVVLREELTPDGLRDGILAEGFRYEDRPAIRTLGYLQRLQELDLKRNRLGFIPTVAATGNYTISGQGQRFFTSSETLWIPSSFIGLNINIPLFDGGQRRYRIVQSQLNVEKAGNNIAFLRQAIDLEQTVSRQSLATSLNDLDIQQRNIELAERVYNSTKLKFEQGLGSSFEVLQSETDLQTAQSNYFNALYNAVVARIGYQRSLGRLQ